MELERAWNARAGTGGTARRRGLRSYAATVSLYSTGRPRLRAISSRCTSDVPSPISRILASR